MSVGVPHGASGYNLTGTEDDDANELVKRSIVCLVGLDNWVGTDERFVTEKETCVGIGNICTLTSS